LSDRIRHHLDDSPWRLPLSSVDLSEMFDPGQIPLGPSRYFLGVPQQDRNPIDIQLCQVLALWALVALRRFESVGAYRAFFAHLKPRLFHKLRATCTLGKRNKGIRFAFQPPYAAPKWFGKRIGNLGQLLSTPHEAKIG
jgi:hypothetical protein